MELIPDPPPSPDTLTFGQAQETQRAKGKLVSVMLASLLFGGIGYGVGLVTSGPSSPLVALHQRALVGCIPVMQAIRQPGTLEAARRFADAQIQGARAFGLTNAGYLVEQQGGEVVVTMYAERCG